MTAKIHISQKNTLIRICAFHQPSFDLVKFGLVNIQKQSSNSECGLFALAVATELAIGNHPDKFWYDDSCMRSHLIMCFEQKDVKVFPKRKRPDRNISMQPYNKIDLISIYCSCRMPLNEKKKMIPCSSCKHMFHVECLDFPPVNEFICKRCL